MNRFSKSMLGVTLLEIMLVLAIAAMIVVMSIRYYQSASSSQQANAALSQIQAVMAAADNLGMAGGYTNATQAKVEQIVGTTNMTTPTGGDITISGQSATQYKMSVEVNDAICTNLLAKFNTTQNPKITGAGCSGGTLSFTYDNTQ